MFLLILPRVTFERVNGNSIFRDSRCRSPGHTDAGVVRSDHAHTADPQTGWRGREGEKTVIFFQYENTGIVLKIPEVLHLSTAFIF